MSITDDKYQVSFEMIDIFVICLLIFLVYVSHSNDYSKKKKLEKKKDNSKNIEKKNDLENIEKIKAILEENIKKNNVLLEQNIENNKVLLEQNSTEVSTNNDISNITNEKPFK